VQKGDTLWKIAKKYMGNEYSSVDDYIEEVCQTNHIYDGKITEDMYLVIPYYK
jgi:nucleoid-associated protein YgaU